MNTSRHPSALIWFSFKLAMKVHEASYLPVSRAMHASDAMRKLLVYLSFLSAGKYVRARARCRMPSPLKLFLFRLRRVPTSGYRAEDPSARDASTPS